MDDKDRVKDAIDIVSYIQRNGVTLKKESRLFVGLCPFHSEKSPSFKVYPETQSYTCFGCGATGDVYTFAMKMHRLEFGEALEELARYANIQLTPLNREKADKRERLYQTLEFAAQYYTRMLHTDTEASREALYYLMGKRGLASKAIGYEGARIGYMPFGSIRPVLKASHFTEQEMFEAGLLYKTDDDQLLDRFRNRIMIPLRDHRGRIVGFVGRALQDDQKPKYLTGPATDLFQKSDLIYRPTSRVKNGPGASFDTIVVVEGQMDAISALNRGFENVVAQMGSTLTDGQMDQICKGNPARVVFCLDKDEAGRKALRTLTQKHITRLASKGITLYAMFSPHGKDPDDCFRERPELWEPAVNAAQPVVRVLVSLEFSALGDHAPGAQKSNLARELLPILRSDDPFIQQENIQILSDETRIPVDNLTAWLIGQSQIRVMPKAAPLASATQEPPLETAILWGIIFNEHERWLQRANGALICLSPLDKPLMYAFAPLNAQDFTHAPYQELMTLISEDMDSLQANVIDTPLYEVYRRIIFDAPVTSMFAADVPKEQPRDTCEEFIDKVLRLRLNRLKADMAARNHFAEAMRGVALIQQKREMQIGG